MSERLDNLLTSIEKLKEVQRITYDYFKHLTTLSASSIGVTAALTIKVFCEPRFSVLLIFSVTSFFLCLLGSLWVMTAPGNAILYLVSIQTFATCSTGDLEKQQEDVAKNEKKYSRSLDQIRFFDFFTKITFLIGIIGFIVFFGLNLK